MVNVSTPRSVFLFILLVTKLYVFFSRNKVYVLVWFGPDCGLEISYAELSLLLSTTHYWVLMESYEGLYSKLINWMVWRGKGTITKGSEFITEGKGFNVKEKRRVQRYYLAGVQWAFWLVCYVCRCFLSEYKDYSHLLGVYRSKTHSWTNCIQVPLFCRC